MHEHEAFIVLLSLALLLGVARLLGEGARVLGRPLVVGEIATGIFLGETGLKRVWPAGSSMRGAPRWPASPTFSKNDAVLLATWNVNGVRARSARLAEFLAERQPDVVCLQELKIVEDEFPHLELRASGYHAVLYGQQGWNGVAVIAKERPELVLRGLPGGEADGSRFLVAKVPFGSTSIEVASVYVPNGKSVAHPDFKVKLSWLDKLASYVEMRADKDVPLILGGDFNVCWTDQDSYGGARFRGKSHHTDEERALLDRLRAAGLVDLYRAKYPDEPGFSWWDYRAGSFHKKEGMRIDLLLATTSIASRVTDVIVEREFRKKGKTSGSIPSDHAPLVAVLT